MDYETFIQKAVDIHGDKYDYSKVVLKKSGDKICIICPTHGEFWMKYGNHLNGKQGCPKCGLITRSEKRKKTFEQFVFDAKQVHGDKYDYSKVEYINTDSYVTIICPIHGEFEQRPYHHISGNGCPKCNGGIAFNNDEFIEKCKKIHNNKYDYSKVEYKGIYQKICVICPIHGEFWQVANSHINGRGCPRCCGKNKNTQDIINEFKQIHDNKYDYSKVEYKGALKKVCIICPIHGEFWQTPHDHLRGCGCKECGFLRAQKSNKNIVQQCSKTFVSKAKEIHGDKYDYSKVEYINAITKICIICPKHGEFWQTPNAHLNGSGCIQCKESSLEEKMRLCLETNQIDYIQEKKFQNFLKRYDFYLPYYNTVIECQGLQHFKDLTFFQKQPFQERLEYDKEKYNFCLNNNIKILYLTKKEYEKNIPFGNGIYFSHNTFYDVNELITFLQNGKK